MSAADVRIAAARGEAEAARVRLIQTVEIIKIRLAPKTIAQETWDGAKAKGSDIADHTITVAKERPALVAGVATGAALLIARKPIWNLISGLFDKSTEPRPATTKVARPDRPVAPQKPPVPTHKE